MQVSFANYSSYGHARIGALLTKDSIHISSYDAIIATPQVINTQGFLTDTVNWVTIEGAFVASGGERYLTIGYFFDGIQNDTLKFQPSSGFQIYGYGYYYIDDVSLMEVAPVENCVYDLPNIFTPNNDGINDNWELNSSSEGRLTIVNRWGNIIMDQTGHEFKWDGENSSDGIYYYTFRSNLISRTGFIQLIR
jgi:gliding motility-associated-like protein